MEVLGYFFTCIISIYEFFKVYILWLPDYLKPGPGVENIGPDKYDDTIFYDLNNNWNITNGSKLRQ